MRLPPVFKTSGPGQVALPMVQGLEGEEGMGVGLFYKSFSHLQRQLEAKQEGTLEEPVGSGTFQAHLDG